MDVVKETEKKMQEGIDRLKHELSGLRTGRASPALLQSVTIEAYGTQMRIRDVASISVPEPRQLLVAPSDVSNVHAIVKGIEEANLNLQASAEGNVVRIKIPEMDQAVRQDMVKQARRKCEEGKVSIRNARRDGNEALKKQKGCGDISEDVLRKMEKKIQELTDKYCKHADAVTAEKEKEIVTI